MEVLIDISTVDHEEWESKFSQHILWYCLGIRLKKEAQDTGLVSQTENVLNKVIITERGRTAIADFVCLPRL
jgi:hypothetical protein